MAPNSLRDYITASLAQLPNPHTFRLHILQSSAKRTTSLFPYAHPSPKVYEREYLITLSCIAPQPSPEPPISTLISPDNQEVLITAIHAYLYTIPSPPSHPSTPPSPSPTPHKSILYISKVDTSGYLPPTSLSPTKTLITSFITHILLHPPRPPSSPPGIPHSVQVNLFARSQGHYLFPNSKEVSTKRVVGGLGLVGWWKGVYEDCAGILADRGRTATMKGGGYGVGDVILSWLLPSYSESEARGMLSVPRKGLPEGLRWVYGPPFTIPLTSQDPDSSSSSSSSTTKRDIESSQQNLELSLGLILPSLPDDPKSRFLDELVSETDTDNPIPLPPRPHDMESQTENNAGKGKTRFKESDGDVKERKAAQAKLGKVSLEEFWERMSFRQECCSGDVTGFFGLSHVVPSIPGGLDGGAGDTEQSSAPTALSAEIADRLHKALLNCDFRTAELAWEASGIWLKSVRSIVGDELGEGGYEACVGVVEGKRGLDGVGAEVKRKVVEEVITVLQPRKKKKP